MHLKYKVLHLKHQLNCNNDMLRVVFIPKNLRHQHWQKTIETTHIKHFTLKKAHCVFMISQLHFFNFSTVLTREESKKTFAFIGLKSEKHFA